MKLTKDNVVDYAWKHYRNPQIFNGDEFFDDMKAFFYVKKLLTRYKKGDSNHHLTLNHIITINNLFGPEATRKLLYFYVPPDCHTFLNTFLHFLAIIPVSEKEVKQDEEIKKFLENL